VCCCRKLVWRGWRRISVLTFVLWVVAAGTHFVHISVNYLAGKLCASVGNCWSICGKVICIPRGIEDSAEPGLSSRSLHWWFCESSIERNYLHPLCAELRIASCTESDNDGDVVLLLSFYWCATDLLEQLSSDGCCIVIVTVCEN